MSAQSELREFILPRDPIELTLAELWINVLGVEPISMRDGFFELGGTSLELLRIAGDVEREFGRKLPLAAFFRHPTIESLGALLRGQGAVHFDSPLVTIRARGDEPPLFLFHDVSGDVTYGYLLAHALGHGRPVYGFQPPGLYNDREPHVDVGAMVDEYLEELLSVQPDGPYALGGHCTGGLLAVEAGARLRAAGHDVAPIALFGSIPWSAQGRAFAAGDVDRSYALYHWLDPHDEPIPFEQFEALTEDEQYAYLLEGWQALDMVPAGAGAAFLRRYADIYIVSARAIARHTASTYDEHACLFLPAEPLQEDQEMIPPAEVRARWLEYARCDVEVHVVPGNHYSMLEREHIDELARRLRMLLDTDDGDSGSSRRRPHPAAAPA